MRSQIRLSAIRLVLPQAAQILPGSHEGILQHIFCRGGIAQHMQGQAIDPLLVIAEQLLESFERSAPSGLDERGFLQRHGRRIVQYFAS